MASAIKHPSRDWPFILKIGSAFKIIVDGKLFLTTTSTSEAIILLLSVFYGFNVSWNPKIKPTFLFFQDTILGKPDSASSADVQVELFNAMLNDAQTAQTAQALRRHLKSLKLKTCILDLEFRINSGKIQCRKGLESTHIRVH